ncbi:hypothetical protein B0P06_000073 [Clostridium saccharoperbutylacetonicum]|nr:hypothetical protein [Clostridium saccharoperbutylacetonicum]
MRNLKKSSYAANKIIYMRILKKQLCCNTELSANKNMIQEPLIILCELIETEEKNIDTEEIIL